jgi:hypothetical protein
MRIEAELTDLSETGPASRLEVSVTGTAQFVSRPDADPVPFRIGAALEAADGPLFERARPDLP